MPLLLGCACVLSAVPILVTVACGVDTTPYVSCAITSMPLVDASCGSAQGLSGDLTQCGLVTPGPQSQAVCLANCGDDAACTFETDAGSPGIGPPVVLCDCH
jgi:hypothetical protein